jgi:hypothetical protein
MTHEAPLDFSLGNLATFKTELDNGLTTLISALDVANKFATFIPGLGTEVSAAIGALTGLKKLVDLV